MNTVVFMNTTSVFMNTKIWFMNTNGSINTKFFANFVNTVYLQLSISHDINTDAAAAGLSRS